ncbi:endospore germination permease [Alicyclobacillus cycloheptanicus]|uniref:Spore germination protein (Amino acid permease) n=1 Tax=Alicyclobacillus cycloheptanicus TaxID=1457 RepID=A0ABT9XKC7_9BACL|nr:endospore germination permease [Alicyclobacillus cycloheptanicus]MDQ0190746.1 spore germination protein (amino acid permease) [Alicyclobacillus cycloheptanicus]WDL99866.1 endospore germination permease [Alicyclobacillus cycloheptanicus]
MPADVPERTSVGGKELTAMMTLFVGVNVFLNYPQYVSTSGLEAGWMVPLLSGAMTLILFLIVEAVLKRHFPGMDIVEVVKESCGRWIAILVALVIVVYFLVSTANVMRQFTENVITTVLPSTPILMVGGLFVVVVSYIAYCGLEGIARISYFLRPILVIGTLLLCVLTVNWWIPSDLLPFWGNGVWQVVDGSLKYSSIFINVLLLCVIYPHAHDPGSLRRVGVTSIAASSLLLAAFLVTYYMVFPAVTAYTAQFPMYQLARIIAIGRYVQHVESLFVFMWVTAAVVKMAITLWGAGYLLASACGWPSFRPAVAALGLIAFSGSLLPSNVAQAIQFDRDVLLSWGWTIVFGLPVAIALTGLLRGKPAKRRAKHA